MKETMLYNKLTPQKHTYFRLISFLLFNGADIPYIYPADISIDTVGLYCSARTHSVPPWHCLGKLYSLYTQICTCLMSCVIVCSCHIHNTSRCDSIGLGRFLTGCYKTVSCLTVFTSCRTESFILYRWQEFKDSYT